MGTHWADVDTALTTEDILAQLNRERSAEGTYEKSAQVSVVQNILDLRNEKYVLRGIKAPRLLIRGQGEINVASADI